MFYSTFVTHVSGIFRARIMWKQIRSGKFQEEIHIVGTKCGFTYVAG
jgi:hypothetical protein